MVRSSRIGSNRYICIKDTTTATRSVIFFSASDQEAILRVAISFKEVMVKASSSSGSRAVEYQRFSVLPSKIGYRRSNSNVNGRKCIIECKKRKTVEKDGLK